jgi:hypothetical protein
VQQEPVGALDPELLGSLATLGIVKGQQFAPDCRIQRILDDAAAVGTAAGRTLNFRPTFTFGPEAPAGRESNWIQTMPGKGWFVILRLYGPLEPFFDKTWRVGEVEPIV